MNEMEDFQRRETALNTAMALAALQNADEKSTDASKSLIAALSKPVRMVNGEEDVEPNRSMGSGYLSLFDVMPANVTTAVIGSN